jgi:DNA mismatch repair protein MutL
MGKIQVLSFEVANLIAAGEVVDRPASAIKEMMENAIDAGAKHITVEIQNGGVSFMRVTDDGCGMSAEDLPMAVRRHATSKIRSAEDLDGIATLGFRGEALAAISSVSCVTIIRVNPFFASSLITACTSPTIVGSRAEVGSSNKMISGSIAKARAIATRCFCPPDSSSG